MSLTFF